MAVFGSAQDMLNSDKVASEANISFIPVGAPINNTDDPCHPWRAPANRPKPWVTGAVICITPPGRRAETIPWDLAGNCSSSCG